MIVGDLKGFNPIIFFEVFGDDHSGVTDIESVYFAISDEHDEGSGAAELRLLDVIVQNVGICLLQHLTHDCLYGQYGVLVLYLL